MELIPSFIANNGWRIPFDEVQALSKYERSFFSNEFLGQRSFPYYLKRLEKLGIKGKIRVLDLACGMGQWSIALAELNQKIDGVDLSSDRIEFAKRLAAAHQRSNCCFQIGSMENIPFADQTFDAVFCYGAFMFANMPVALKEIRRVCAPGAIIYLNANSFGWYLHLLFDRGILVGNWQMARTSIRMMWRGVRTLWSSAEPLTQMMVLPLHMRRLASSEGLEIVGQGPEGTIGAENSDVEPAYPKKFYGFTGILEFSLKTGGLR